MAAKKNEIIYSCNPIEVVVPEGRQRKEFDKNKLRDLAESIAQYGMIGPGLCYMGPDKRPVLIAGERRLRACQIAEVDYKYVLRKKGENDSLLLELELEENLCRVNLTWLEEVEAKEKLHELYQKKEGMTKVGAKGGHTLEQTARILNESRTGVGNDIKLAQYAKHLTEIREAGTKTEAKKIMKRIEDTLMREQALKKAAEGDHKLVKKITGVGTPLVEPAEGEKFNEPTKAQIEEELDIRMREYAKRTKEGTMEESIKRFPDEHFNVVLFDPPWGVDLHEVQDKKGNQPYEDSSEKFGVEFPKWLGIIWEKMAIDSHLFVFFGIANFAYVYECIEKQGFSVNRIPIIWQKKGAHVTRNPKIWPGRSYEPIAYCRKGSKDLQLQGMPDIISTQAPTQAIKGGHPSAKHPDIYRQLLRLSCMPGDKVIDPMAGSGMAGVAAESLISSLYLDWHLIEKERNYRLIAVQNLLKGYERISLEGTPKAPTPPKHQKGSIANFQPKKDYRNIEPRSPAWQDYWQKHPEQHKEMTEWAIEEEGSYVNEDGMRVYGAKPKGGS